MTAPCAPKAEAAKDKALLALLKGEIDGEAYAGVTAAGRAGVATQRAQAAGMRQAQSDKQAAEAAAVAAAEAHAARLKGVKKQKPRRPAKGPDSSVLCFNLETRQLILGEPGFEGASMAALGGELRARWAALSFAEQAEWEAKAAANKAAHKVAMAEHEAAMDVYNGKAEAVAAEVGPKAWAGPRVDPEFLRRNFKGRLPSTL